MKFLKFFLLVVADVAITWAITVLLIWLITMFLGIEFSLIVASAGWLIARLIHFAFAK